jgi:putative endonuclease
MMKKICLQKLRNINGILRFFNSRLSLDAVFICDMMEVTTKNSGFKMGQTQKTGNKGESIARDFLIQKSYIIVDTNWSTRFGELDIVAKKDDVYVFVEVKARHSKDTESAFASITPSKREKMIKAVYQYIHEKDLDDIDWRIDAIGIALLHNQSPIIDHVEDAFDW